VAGLRTGINAGGYRSQLVPGGADAGNHAGWLTLQGVPHDMLYVNPQIWVLSGR